MFAEALLVTALLGQLSDADAGTLVLSEALDAGTNAGIPTPRDVLDAGSAVAIATPAPVALEDAATPVEHKRASLRQLSPAPLLAALARVQPDAQREQLCHELRDLLPAALLKVQSVDANDEVVEATVLVDGREVGTAPWDEMVPACVRRVVVQRGGEARSEDITLEPKGRRTVRVDWGGAKRLWVASAMADFSFFSPSLRLVPPGAESATGLVGFGARLESFASVFHFSIAVNVNPLYGPLLAAFGLRDVPVVPMIDLFFGASFRPGSRTVRAVIALDAGLWQLLAPALRLVVGVILFDRLLITANTDVRLMALGFAIPTLQLPIISAGFSLNAGVGW